MRRVLIVIGSVVAFVAAAIVLSLLWLGPIQRQQRHLACPGQR